MNTMPTTRPSLQMLSDRALWPLSLNQLSLKYKSQPLRCGKPAIMSARAVPEIY
jgi:hypothetical protein